MGSARGERGMRRRSLFGGRLLTTMMVAAFLAIASGCSRKVDPNEPVEPIPPTTLRVENQAFLDMTIYVYRSTQRIRLGTATGNTVTRLRIPANLIFGATSLRFQADPIGSTRSSISTEITVAAGDEVMLTIPPR